MLGAGALGGCSKDTPRPAVTRSGADLVQVTGSVDSALLTAIQHDAQNAIAAVASFWGADPGWGGGRPAQVRVFTDQAQFVAAGGDPHARSVTSTTTQDGVVLVGPQLARAAPGARVFVLTHELTHLRLGVRSAADRWVAEGAAELTALLGAGMSLATYAPTLAARVRAGQVPERPPADAALESSATDLRGAYQQACAFSRFLLARAGGPTYRGFVEMAMAGGDGTTDDAFTSSFGAARASFGPDFRRWLVGQMNARG